MLIAAESEGRRESLLELLRDNRIEPPSVASLADFQAGDEAHAIVVAPLADGFFWHEPDALPGSTGGGAAGIQFVTETELFASSPTARRRRKQEQVSDVNALIKDLSELKSAIRWCMPTTASAATSDCATSTSATATANSCTSNTPTRRRCTCRSRSCT